MLKPIIKLAGVTLLIACTWVGSANAQTVPSPKRALIKELLELTQAGDSANAILNRANANEILNQSLADMKAVLPKLSSGFFEGSGLEGDALKKRANDIALRIIQRYQERVPKVLDIKQITEEISYSLYDKFYTEAELKDVIDFYKTSTGQKVIAMMPKLFFESSLLSNELVRRKVANLMREIIEEELSKLPAKSK